MSDPNRPLQRGQLETSTVERLAAIVEAAERAATKVIDDAETQARRYLEEARAEADRLRAERLAELAGQTGSLIAQAEEIRQRSERLLDALTAARARLEAELAGGGREGAAFDGEGARSARNHLTAVPPSDPQPPAVEPVPPLEPEPVPQASPAGARLLATQMAVSGNSREEIAARLRNGFRIEDTDAILDAILGPEET